MKTKLLKVYDEIAGRISTKNLEVDEIFAIIKFQKAIKEKIDGSREVQISLFKHYEVNRDEAGNHDWADHADKEEITSKLKDIMEMDHEVFLEGVSKEKLVEASIGMSIAQITLLLEI